MPEITRDETMEDLLGPIEEKVGADVVVGDVIRALREKRGLSVQDMALKTGFSAALLSQVENRMTSPSLGTLVRIAHAFEVPVSSLLGATVEKEFSIVRKEERSVVSRVGLKGSASSAYSYESLGAGKAGRKMEPFIVRLRPKAESGIVKSSHDGEEFLFVLSGEVEIVLGELSDTLREGDSVYYSSTIPHHVHSANAEEAIILAVVHPG